MNLGELAGRPVIIGSGIAGLMTALDLAPEPVVLVTKAALGAQSSSALAQGGLAAAVGADDDPALHLADTLTAGDGLSDREAARLTIEAAPAAIETLRHLGVRFDETADGGLRLGLEAAHSRRRIVHACGDGSGREIIRALSQAVRETPSIAVLENVEVRRLIVADGAVHGVVAYGAGGATVLPTNRVVIATGGIGGLFEDSTNPPACWGQGLILAAHAGAELADLEFIQYHPTALDSPHRPMRLVSEAVRGEGAVLVDETGTRFMAGVAGADLAPRDVVARAVAAHLKNGHRVFLDARQSIGVAFSKRFPAIAASCHEAGVDPAREAIPVRPAVHYHMGGIAVDCEGRSTVRGLWACGEAASSGLHGANRLASNSLIEGAIFARIVAQSILSQPARTLRTFHLPASLAIEPHSNPAAVRSVLSKALGVVRNGDELRSAIAHLSPLASSNDAATLALMLTVAALRRQESRGAHFRADFPHQASVARHSRLTLQGAIAAARDIAPAPLPQMQSA
jgi:L-aspartate oxidase